MEFTNNTSDYLKASVFFEKYHILSKEYTITFIGKGRSLWRDITVAEKNTESSTNSDILEGFESLDTKAIPSINDQLAADSDIADKKDELDKPDKPDEVDEVSMEGGESEGEGDVGVEESADTPAITPDTSSEEVLVPKESFKEKIAKKSEKSKAKSEILWQCSIPDNTELQEHTLKTEQSIIIGDRCIVDFGISGDEVMISEFCHINGNIHADGDLRIGSWSEINGDITSGGNAYLGEGVKIKGRLTVDGDLDIGDNVSIDSGFEAKGWISIRNPLPVITYIMLYLITLLGIEKEEDIDKFFKSFFADDGETEETPLVIPPNSTLNMEVFTVLAAMSIGRGCRLFGNIRAKSMTISENNTIFGSLNTDSDITINSGSVVHGGVTTSGGSVNIAPNVHILGDVRCQSLMLDEDARLDGTIKAPSGVKIVRR